MSPTRRVVQPQPKGAVATAVMVKETVVERPILDRDRIKSIVESLLFVSDRVLTIKDFSRVLGEDVEESEIKSALEALEKEYSKNSRGFNLWRVGGGYQFRSNPENADWIAKLVEGKPAKLSRAALEVLAIIAYRQPITRTEIEELRGVDSGGVLKVLLERKLIKVIARKQEPGRPRVYGTTQKFLELFGLNSLKELPQLRDFEELTDESRKRLDELLTKGIKVKQRKTDAPTDTFSAGSMRPDE